jgi:tetratricopeptide (TPR) repeat protein
VALDNTDGEAWYELACAMARLARIKDAMTALERAIKLFPEQTEWLADEEDLKPLANLPAFKKLMSSAEKN